MRQTSPSLAIEQLYNEYHQPIFQYLKRLVSHHESAEDLVQATFIKALRHSEQLDHVVSARGWLYRIATNTAYDYLRRRSRVEMRPLTEAQAQVFAAPPTETRFDDIEPILTALQHLPEHYRRPLLLAVAAQYGAGALPPLTQTLNIAISYIVTLVVNFFIGGILGEEPGWRGFALPRLQARYGPLLGSLVLSILWSVWHLPLILTPGGSTWTGSLALYVALNIALTLLLTWLSNGTHSSLLSLMLLHAAINTSARLVLPNVPGLSRHEGNLLLVAVYGALALLVVVLTKGRLAESVEHLPQRRRENQ